MVIGNGVIGLSGEDPSTTTSLYVVDPPAPLEGTDKSRLSDEALDAGISNEPLGVDVNILFMWSWSCLGLAADFDTFDPDYGSRPELRQ